MAIFLWSPTPETLQVPSSQNKFLFLTNRRLSFWLILSFFIFCTVLKISWSQNISCSVPSWVSLLLNLLQSTNVHLHSYLHYKGLLLSTLKKGYPKSQTAGRIFWVQGHEDAGQSHSFKAIFKTTTLRWWCESTFLKLNLQGSALFFSGYHTDTSAIWIGFCESLKSGSGDMECCGFHNVFLLFPPESQDDVMVLQWFCLYSQSSLQIDSGTL